MAASQIPVPEAMTVPLPKRTTFPVGFRGSLEENPNTALLLPVNIGRNVKVMVQNPFVGNIDVQSFVWLNSEAFAPEMLISLISRSDVPVFLIITAFGKEVLPACTDPKLTDVGVSEILGGGVFPKSFTDRLGFLGSLEETVMSALF